MCVAELKIEDMTGKALIEILDSRMQCHSWLRPLKLGLIFSHTECCGRRKRRSFTAVAFCTERRAAPCCWSASRSRQYRPEGLRTRPSSHELCEGGF